MKYPNNVLIPFLLILLATISSCEVIGGIFKAGIWVGIILVVLIIAIIFWIRGKAKK